MRGYLSWFLFQSIFIKLQIQNLKLQINLKFKTGNRVYFFDFGIYL